MVDKDKDLNILDMDFGDFLTPSGDLQELIPPAEETTEEPENTEKPAVLEEEIDVNKIFEEVANAAEEEEVEEEIKEKEETPGSNLSEETPSEDEPFTLVLARYQLETGVLSSLDEEALLKVHNEEGPAAAMTYLLKTELENNTAGIKTQYDEFAKEYTELREAGYSTEEAGNIVMNLEEINKIEEEALVGEDNETLRRAVIKENYKVTTRFTEAKIDRLIKRSFDLGDDEEEAKEALESLKEIKKQDLVVLKKQKQDEQVAAENQYKAQLQELNTTINDMSEIIPGEKLTKAAKEKIIKTITTPVKNAEDGVLMNAIWSKRTENPVKFDAVLAYLLHSGVFEGKWDKIMRTAGTKVTSRLEEQLNNTNSTGFLKGGKRIVGGDNNDTSGDMISPMKNLFKT